MKKVVFTSLILFLVFGIHAQDADGKKVQAGLTFGTGMNFQKMNTKRISTSGVGTDLSVGAIVNIGFNNNIGLSTGLEFDFDNSKYKMNGITTYKYKDNKIYRKTEDGANAIFQVETRNQKAIYLTIPTMLIFRTNYIGYFRYFGKFGLRNSFLLSSKLTDTGKTLDIFTLLANDAATKNENMKMNSGNDMLFYRGSVGLAAGAEWNFVGTTCLALEVGYYYGITPLYYNSKEDKRTLHYSELTSSEFINNAATQSQLLFKLSVLF